MNKILCPILISMALASCAPSNTTPKASDDNRRMVEEARQRRITELETQIEVQRHATDRWQTTTAGLGIGCVVLLILGTSLGAKTRHDAVLS